MSLRRTQHNSEKEILNVYHKSEINYFKSLFLL
jgi:hypothetical protein